MLIGPHFYNGPNISLLYSTPRSDPYTTLFFVIFYFNSLIFVINYWWFIHDFLLKFGVDINTVIPDLLIFLIKKILLAYELIKLVFSIWLELRFLHVLVDFVSLIQFHWHEERSGGKFWSLNNATLFLTRLFIVRGNSDYALHSQYAFAFILVEYCF